MTSGSDIERLLDGWLAVAPSNLAEAYIAGKRRSR